MAYDIDVGPVREALDELPRPALVAFAAALAVLEATPWSGDPLVDANPGGAVRTLPFGGTGLITYVVLEQFVRVDVLQVHWVG